MENLGVMLFNAVKELSDIEVQEKELKFAIFNNRAVANYEKRIKVIVDNFANQSAYYGKQVNDFIDEENIIIQRYNEEFQKIYDKRKNQYVNIVNEIQEMQSNQKIALANINSLSQNRDSIIKSREFQDYMSQKDEFEYNISISKNNADIEEYKNSLDKLINPLDDIDEKLVAVADKYEKYDGLIFECEKKLDDCIKALEDDFDSIMRYRNNSLVVPQKENLLVRLFNKIFGRNKKYKTEVIDKMTFEIDDIKENNLQLLEVIDKQTINLIAKIEELRYNINFEFNTSTE